MHDNNNNKTGGESGANGLTGFGVQAGADSRAALRQLMQAVTERSECERAREEGRVSEQNNERNTRWKVKQLSKRKQSRTDQASDQYGPPHTCNDAHNHAA